MKKKIVVLLVGVMLTSIAWSQKILPQGDVGTEKVFKFSSQIDLASKSSETNTVFFTTERLKDYFDTIITAAIQKARREVEKAGQGDKPKMTLHSVKIIDSGKSLSYTVILRAHARIFTFAYAEIKLVGGIVQNRGMIELTDPKITAAKKSTVDSARGQIEPVFPTILPIFLKKVSAENGNKKVKTGVIKNGGVEIRLEQALLYFRSHPFQGGFLCCSHSQEMYFKSEL